MTARFDLTEARLNRGLTARALASELEISEPTYRKLEKGGRVHPATAKRVADFFGIKVTDIMPVDRSAA